MDVSPSAAPHGWVGALRCAPTPPARLVDRWHRGDRAASPPQVCPPSLATNPGIDGSPYLAARTAPRCRRHQGFEGASPEGDRYDPGRACRRLGYPGKTTMIVRRSGWFVGAEPDHGPEAASRCQSGVAPRRGEASLGVRGGRHGHQGRHPPLSHGTFTSTRAMSRCCRPRPGRCRPVGSGGGPSACPTTRRVEACRINGRERRRDDGRPCWPCFDNKYASNQTATAAANSPSATLARTERFLLLQGRRPPGDVRK